MATLHIASKSDIAKAQRIDMLIDSGDLPKPPATIQQKRNECDCCHEAIVLRYYHRNYGWCCEICAELPTICTTRADKVHRGRHHIVPALLDNDAAFGSNTSVTVKPTVAAVARQDERSAKTGDIGYDWVAERVAQIKKLRGPESVAAEQRWHDARRLGEMRRGAVVARLS